MTSGLATTPFEHPLETLVARLESLVAEHADAPAWILGPRQLAALLPRLATLTNQLDALELRVLREADRHAVGDAVGSASTAGWWATTTRTTKPAAHRAVALAARLDDDSHTPTRAATIRGTVSLAQAAVILDAVDALPTELVGRALKVSAEEHLVSLAEQHDPRELRLLGRRVLEVIAPDVAEEAERRVLETEEADARATATFTMRRDGHGSTIGRFKIPVLAGEMLAKHLNAIAAPRHQRTTGEARPVTRPLRLGAAFTEYVETRPHSAAPRAGGVAATVVVTMTLADLLGANHAATLDTGERISASEARRLACEAGIVPAVLGGPSQVLDLGRRARFHTEPQRIAMALRDGGCAELHCDWPPGMCHAHHLTQWSHGGRTSVDDGRLLCPRHHTMAHSDRFQMKSDKSGRVLFTRRE